MNRNELEAEIRAAAAAATEVDRGLEQFAEQVKEYWRSASPVNRGQYAASVQVFKRKYVSNGMPARRVGATDFKAHWIEFGTRDKAPDSDGKGGHEATQAFAPRAKTVAHFNGDESRVDMVIADQTLSYEQRTALLGGFSSIEAQ